MNLGTELQFTLASFIGFMLESIFYGKHYPTTAFGSDTDLWAPSYRYLLRDICCICKNPTQENTWIKSRSCVLDHCQFHCVHGISRCWRDREPVDCILRGALCIKCTIYMRRLHFTSNIGEISYMWFSPHHWCAWLSLFNKDIPMLDHLAPTMGYGCPDPVNTCILRY